MKTIDEVMTIVRRMSPDELDQLRQLIDEIDQQEWQKERTTETRAFHDAGLTDADIDDAVRKLRYESRP